MHHIKNPAPYPGKLASIRYRNRKQGWFLQINLFIYQAHISTLNARLKKLKK